MGTRNLTLVRAEGQYRVAQYGQWDGYPEGVGRKILEVLNTHTLESLREAVMTCQPIDEELLNARWEAVGAVTKWGWVTTDVADKFKEQWPWLYRDCSGGYFLELLMESYKEIGAWKDFVNLSVEFATNGLFCEYCYLIDFDRSVFEVYTGFSKVPGRTPPPGIEDVKNEDGYYPVALAGSWPLEKLPTLEDLVKACDKSDEDTL